MEFGLPPGKTTYRDCKAGINNNFGAYISGGQDVLMTNCDISNTRNDTLTLYTGDAQGGLNITLFNCVINSSTRANANKNTKINSINEQIKNTTSYLKASKLKAVFDSCDFVGNPSFTQIIEVRKNSDVTFSKCTIKQLNLYTIDAFAGATGVVHNPFYIDNTLFIDFHVDLCFRVAFKVYADKLRFTSTLASKAVFMSNTEVADSVFSNCCFGANRVGELVNTAYLISAAIRVISHTNDFRNMVAPAIGFNITTANASELTTYGNHPQNTQFEQISWRTSAVMPTVGTWRAGDFVRNSSPSQTGGKILFGWACVDGGTPGTWFPLYATNT